MQPGAIFAVRRGYNESMRPLSGAAFRLLKLIGPTIAFILAACSPSLRPPPTSPLTGITPWPTATRRLLATLTPTQMPPSIIPAATRDPDIFRDEFAGRLDEGWTWIREDPSNWSLTERPGMLQIKSGGGTVLAGSMANVLLRAAPAGDFIVETQVTFVPRDNFQFAGLILYQDDMNFIQVGRSYCRSPGCVGEGLYVTVYRNGAVVEPNFGQTFKELDPLRLRVSHRGNRYLFEGSRDSRIWFIIGSHVTDLQPTEIGLIAGQNVEGSPQSAEFDFFELRTLP